MNIKSLLFLILFVASSAWAQQKDALQNLVSLVGHQVSVATFYNRPIALTVEAQRAILQVENMIQVTYRKGHPHDPEPLNFQANHCTGATWALGIIGNSFKHRSRLMLTQSAMGLSSNLHYYLIFENILVSGDRYIVDPTIRQFFVKTVSKKELEAVPEIFVGTASQLQNMFFTVLKKYYTVDEIKKNWVNVYLTAREKFSY